MLSSMSPLTVFYVRVVPKREKCIVCVYLRPLDVLFENSCAVLSNRCHYSQFNITQVVTRKDEGRLNILNLSLWF